MTNHITPFYGLATADEAAAEQQRRQLKRFASTPQHDMAPVCGEGGGSSPHCPEDRPPAKRTASGGWQMPQKQAYRGGE